MIGRREFGMVSLGALAYATFEGTGLAQQRTAGESHQPKHSGNDEMLKKCATACSDCQRACDSCATHCAHLMQSGKTEHFTTLMTCRDCADFCVAAAQMVSRGGPFMDLICKACEQACARCGKECEKFPDDKHMKMCAEECRKCEKACRDMVAQVGHGERRQ